MIKSFRHKGLKRLYEAQDRRGVSPEHVARIENILGLLDTARTAQELNLPSFRLHLLTGDLRGFWSVVVRANWRSVFRFEDTDACDVDLVDYH